MMDVVNQHPQGRPPVMGGRITPSGRNTSMTYEVAEHAAIPGQWHVERVLENGEIEVAIFTGPRSEGRAREYARQKNARIESRIEGTYWVFHMREWKQGYWHPQCGWLISGLSLSPPSEIGPMLPQAPPIPEYVVKEQEEESERISKLLRKIFNPSLRT